MTVELRDGQADAVVIGGGFYGCCLALVLRSLFQTVVIVEAEDRLLTRASYVNQARVHTGFHYPRSFVTARRSLALHAQFRRDFAPAIFSDFRMLYAVARHGSKITAQRFEKMFMGMNAPLERASQAEKALFNPDLVAGVFRCEEAAFDASELRRLLQDRLNAAGVRVLTRARVAEIGRNEAGIFRLRLDGGATLAAPVAFDATYGQTVNQGIVRISARLKYEETEVALIEPPEDLRGFGITVMDGPFFSTMPFPAEGCYSLTHVRYTPGRSWTSSVAPPPPLAVPQSRWLHMARDCSRFVPSLARLTYLRSLRETKTVLQRNEGDDGRPILLDQDDSRPGLFVVLGGKLDNIYDLFDALRTGVPGYGAIHTGYLEGRSKTVPR